jgi:hypothetical protein
MFGVTQAQTDGFAYHLATLHLFNPNHVIELDPTYHGSAAGAAS